jgi:hypothetical protein
MSGMTYRAAVAYPCIDHDRAVATLRARLREMAARGGAPAVEWSTLRVVGPDEVVGAHGRVWYEWAATVEPVAASTGDQPQRPDGLTPRSRHTANHRTAHRSGSTG